MNAQTSPPVTVGVGDVLLAPVMTFPGAFTSAVSGLRPFAPAGTPVDTGMFWCQFESIWMGDGVQVRSRSLARRAEADEVKRCETGLESGGLTDFDVLRCIDF